MRRMLLPPATGLWPTEVLPYHGICLFRAGIPMTCLRGPDHAGILRHIWASGLHNRCGNLFGEDTFSKIIPRPKKHNQGRPVISDGTYIRDYFYVGCGKRYLLAEKMERAPSVRPSTSAMGSVTVPELVEGFLRLWVRTWAVILNQADEIRHQYLDASKARLLGGLNTALMKGLRGLLNGTDHFGKTAAMRCGE